MMVTLSDLISWTSAMPTPEPLADPDPVADPGVSWRRNHGFNRGHGHGFGFRGCVYGIRHGHVYG